MRIEHFVDIQNGSYHDQIPFFQTLYRVSPFGVLNDRGRRPDYGTCVILLKYLLMCPLQVSCNKDWITYRDFADSGPGQ